MTDPFKDDPEETLLLQLTPRELDHFVVAMGLLTRAVQNPKLLAQLNKALRLQAAALDMDEALTVDLDTINRLLHKVQDCIQVQKLGGGDEHGLNFGLEDP